MWTHFLESEKPALQGLPREGFALFDCGDRSVHPDGHVEVAGAFYPAPGNLIGQSLRVRWDDHLVRLHLGDTPLGVFRRQQPGTYAPRPGQAPAEAPYAQRAFVAKLLGRCRQVGPQLHEWAEQALEERGVRAIRLIQGVLGLARTHPRERLCAVALQATTHRLFRYRDLRRLAELAAARTPAGPTLIAEHPSIRSMDHYRLEEFE